MQCELWILHNLTDRRAQLERGQAVNRRLAPEMNKLGKGASGQKAPLQRGFERAPADLPQSISNKTPFLIGWHVES